MRTKIHFTRFLLALFFIFALPFHGVSTTTAEETASPGTESTETESTETAPDEAAKMSAMEKVQQTSDAVKQASNNCVQTGQCIPAMYFCPNNLLCYNNCEIGHDPDAINRAAMVGVLAFFGLGDIPVEGNTLIACRRSCVAKSISDCHDAIPGCEPADTPKCLKKKPQPPLYWDTENVPATADPARICREYCGAWPGWPGYEKYQWCENRCKALDALSDCFKRNKGATDILKTCGYEGKQTGGSEGQWSKDSLVAIKLNSFVQEATCVFDQEAGRPDSDSCKYLCKDKTGVAKEQDLWLRSCHKRSMAEIEASRLKQLEVEMSLKRAVGTAIESARKGAIAVIHTQNAVKSMQAERAENVADYEAQQKREQEQAEKELAAEQKQQ